jgi:perosamine synthetase
MGFINQFEPWFDEQEKKAIIGYMNSGGWLTEFKKTKEFEQMIANYTGVKYCSVVSNGTVSLIAALLAFGIGKNDEVIVPDYTMIATANSVLLTGAKPVFVDVEKETVCIDFEEMKKKITRKTKSLMLVSINGRYPTNVKEIIKYCQEQDIVVIEDAAQSLGSFFQKKHVGTLGDVGSFSFSMPKIITTGQGGALITNDKEIYDKLNKIKDFGRKQSGIDKYEMLGFNFKFTDLQAVIGIEQIKKLDYRVKRKKEIFNLYKKKLNDIEKIDFVRTLSTVAPWFIDILVPAPQNLQVYLKGKNIGSRLFYPALHTQAPYNMKNVKFPNAEFISSHGLWLPSSSQLKDIEIEYICTSIAAFYKK